MKIIHLDIRGISTPNVMVGETKDGRRKFYYISHGEQGRGRWEYRMPLGAKDFPYEEGKEIDLSSQEFSLIDLGRKDAAGNEQYLLVKGKEDGKFLVLWELDPGFRGSASYEIEGSARLLAEGEEAQGLAGRMGGAMCPVVLVEGPCTLKWHREGRLYGSPSDWVAKFDGESWSVGPADEVCIEDSIFDY